MRLWTLHPQHLDAKGLVALWREGLLAQKVLRGLTRGYTRHPQLLRFRQQPDPVAAVVAYLWVVQGEATARGYNFDAGRIASGVELARPSKADSCEGSGVSDSADFPGRPGSGGAAHPRDVQDFHGASRFADLNETGRVSDCVSGLPAGGESPSRDRVGSGIGLIVETRGQLLFEWGHFLHKVEKRAPDHFQQARRIQQPEPHPLFWIVDGPLREWEKI